MNAFMNRDFLLHNSAARTLYHETAERMPIYDYHNHLSPKEIYENKPYRSITELWLAHDHYKWRAMRAAGVSEDRITGNADDREKFRAWAAVVARLPLCPLYHWTHLELQRYFGIYEPLNATNADKLFDLCNQRLAEPDFRPRELLAQRNVKVLGTTDNPWDSLEWHQRLAGESLSFTVRPSFRPDRLLQPDQPDWRDAVASLECSEGIAITDYGTLLTALEHSLDRFQALGCRAADHGFSRFDYLPADRRHDVRTLCNQALSGGMLSTSEAASLRSALLEHLAVSYTQRGLVMQLHTGPIRNPNIKMFHLLGPDSGFDCVGAPQDPAPYHAFFSHLETIDSLPKAILYGIHPADTNSFATMAVSYCRTIPGRMQLGSAWWFNDTINGMRQQLTAAAEAGLLSGFVGMLTDSRSMTAFSRHEYFRRILCALLGDAVESGEYPASELDTLKALVQDVCYYNAIHFFEEES